jgi:hypothetical protein
MARRALTETDLGVRLDTFADPRAGDPATAIEDGPADRPEGGVFYGKHKTKAIVLVGCKEWSSPCLPPDELGRCPVCKSPKRMRGATVCLNCHQSSVDHKLPKVRRAPVRLAYRKGELRGGKG